MQACQVCGTADVDAGGHCTGCGNYRGTQSYAVSAPGVYGEPAYAAAGSYAVAAPGAPVSPAVPQYPVSPATAAAEPYYAPYEGDGRRNQPFDPQMMVTVLLYAYATGTFSSRRIARKLEEDVAYRVLAAGNFPAHRTIADFRQQHLAAFERLFVAVVQIAREAGVVQLGRSPWMGRKSKPMRASTRR